MKQIMLYVRVYLRGSSNSDRATAIFEAAKNKINDDDDDEKAKTAMQAAVTAAKAANDGHAINAVRLHRLSQINNEVHAMTPLGYAILGGQ